jgi:ketosteroid isomerase-like protein
VFLGGRLESARGVELAAAVDVFHTAGGGRRGTESRLSGSRIATLALCALGAIRVGAPGPAAPLRQSAPPPGKEDVVAKSAIRERVEDLAKAVGAKDIDRVMAFYAPDVVSFDIGPPLRYGGLDRKRRAWQDVFATYPGPFSYEIRELDVAADGALAFVHGVNRVKGTLANGHVTDMWVRWTACFRRIDGAWRVVHDHVSVPAELEHGRALVNLTP